MRTQWWLIVVCGLIGWSSAIHSVVAQSGLATLSVEKIHATPSLQVAMDDSGKKSSLGRVLEAFDTQLMDRLNASRKFKVTAVSDLADLLKAVNRAGQSAETKTLVYGVVATLDDFEDATERVELKTLNKLGLKRKVRLNVVAKIYDLGVDPPELFETANIRVAQKDDRMEDVDLQRNAEQTDELLIRSAREAAERVTDRILEVAFPTKVLARSGEQITINRGDAAGVEVGQVWMVFAPGKTLTDPDTGEVLGREELPMGKARILSVRPKFSSAEILEGAERISEGMILRRGLP